MPNWCNNNLTLQHEDPEMIKRAEKAFYDNALCQEFYPCPQELLDTVSGFGGDGYDKELREFKNELNIKYFGYPDWYTWRVAKWGSKWDVGIECGGGDGYCSLEDGTLYLSFLSAWSPPVEFYKHLVELGFVVHATYYEMGCAFCGIFDNDTDECYEIQDDPEWIKANIPQEILDEHGIYEDYLYMKEEENAEAK